MFEDILTQDDVWNYLEYTLIPTTYVETDYNNNILSTDRWGYVLDVNKIIGAVRIQQQRVKLEDKYCAVPPVYEKEIDRCYPSLDVGGSDGTTYGRHREFESQVVGDIGMRKTVFIQDIPSNIVRSEALAKVAALKNQSFTDLQTRQLAVYFTVYNPAVDLFCSIKLTFDFVEAGGVKVKSDFRTVNLMRHLLLITDARDYFPPTWYNWLVLLLETVFNIFALNLFVTECRKLGKVGVRAYVAYGWNVLDFINLSIFIIMFFLKLLVMFKISELEFRPKGDEYAEFYETAYWIYQVQNWTAVNCVLSYCKLFKYLKLSPRLGQLTATLQTASDDLVGFTIMFAIIFISYAQAFYMAFGMDLVGFKDFVSSIYTLLLIILGEFDFDAMRKANQLLGPLLFITYIFVVFFILVNMFLAILNDAHSVVKARAYEVPDPFVEHLRAGFAKRFNRVKKSETQLTNLADITKELDHADDDGIVDKEELERILLGREEEMKNVFGTSDVDELIAKYDGDGDGNLNAAESKQLLNMLQTEVEGVHDRLTQERKEAGKGMAFGASLGLDGSEGPRANFTGRYGRSGGPGGPMPPDFELLTPEQVMSLSKQVAVMEEEQKVLKETISQNQDMMLNKITALTDTMVAIASKIGNR